MATTTHTYINKRVILIIMGGRARQHSQYFKVAAQQLHAATFIATRPTLCYHGPPPLIGSEHVKADSTLNLSLYLLQERDMVIVAAAWQNTIPSEAGEGRRRCFRLFKFVVVMFAVFSGVEVVTSCKGAFMWCVRISLILAF